MAGFNYGEMLKRHQGIKAGATKNALADMQLDLAKKKIAQNAFREQARVDFLAPQDRGAMGYEEGYEPMASYPQGEDPNMVPQMTQDPTGYTNALRGQGDQEGVNSFREQEMNQIKELLALDPTKGEAAWNKSSYGKEFGPLKYMGVKGDSQIFKDNKTGALTAVDKKTLEVTPLTQGSGKEEKPVMTKPAALKRISAIKKTISDLSKGKAVSNELMDSIAETNPQLAGMMAQMQGGEPDQDMLAESINALQEEADALEPYAYPGDTKDGKNKGTKAIMDKYYTN